MLASSCLAGIAFSNCALGICHGVAHTFGATYGIPHGLANAVTLPYSIAFNSEHDERSKERYSQLAHFVGKDNLEQVILDLRSRLGVPATMRELVPDSTEFEAAFDGLVQKVIVDVATPANPVKIDEGYAAEMLRRTYYGVAE
jgi:alcohol dehydrogenase class IV